MGVQVFGHGAYDGGRQRGLLGDMQEHERSYLGTALRQAWTELVAGFRRAESGEEHPEAKYILTDPATSLSTIYRRRPKDPNAPQPEEDPRQFISHAILTQHMHRARSAYMDRAFAEGDSERDKIRWRQLDKYSSAFTWALVPR